MSAHSARQLPLVLDRLRACVTIRSSDARRVDLLSLDKN